MSIFQQIESDEINIIEFSGELTGKSRDFLISFIRRYHIIFAIFYSALVAVPIIIVSIHFDIPYLLYALVLPAFLLIIISMEPSKRSQKDFPNRVFVDLADETVVMQGGEKFETFHMISSVKEVRDYGEFYYLKFYYADRDMWFVCQKSLLTKGTIEEFEAVFSGKIRIMQK